MASYLWVRGQTWFFQLRPPSDLKPFLGSTPFRVRLLVQTRREASRCARHLAGLAERWFSEMRYRGLNKLRVHRDQGGDEAWTDQDHLESQAATRRQFMEVLLAEVQRINRKAEEWETLNRIKKTASPDDAEAASEKQNKIFDSVTESWNGFAKELLQDYDTVFADMQLRSFCLSRTAQKLDELNENYRDDFYDWKEKVSKISAEARASETARQSAHEINTGALAELQTALKNNAEIQSRLLYEGPLLSECLGEFLAAKKKQLPDDSREPAYFEHRLNALLSIVGDKQIAAYNISDLGLLAERLQYLPKRHVVDPKWRNKSLLETIEDNSTRVNKGRCLSEVTVRVNYIGKIKTTFRWLCAQYKVKYPFAYDNVLIPKVLAPSIERSSLDADKLNSLFIECVRNIEKKRPEDVWLPLLAYLTGARLAELVDLRLADIKRYHGEDIVDLTTRIKDDAGVEGNRQIKNRESRRKFALHQKLRELGFIDWVAEQRQAGHKFLFPDLHRAKRPSHAASKRFQRLFGKLGWEPEFVFHSLRHSFKDWTRSQNVSERTIAIQAGHSLDGVALNYGNKKLRSDEFKLLASLPLQEGVDLGVFKGKPFPRPSTPPIGSVPPVDPVLRSRSPKDHGRSTESVIRPQQVTADKPETLDGNKLDIRKLRQDLGMTQRFFAETFGFSCGVVRDWEQGRGRPGRSAQARLLAIMRDPERMTVSGNGWHDRLPE
jgi:integrase/DNA-binding transcriptional regulator YiaG